jgi:hypothetical protein
LVRLEDFPALHKSFIESESRLAEIRSHIREKVSGPHDEICVFAVGSYGRREAQKSVSDFEWMTVYDDTKVSSAEALVFQSQLTAYFASIFGRKNLSINKTFGEVASFTDLSTNVGGEGDTNRALTYRMLTLCEGSTVNDSAAYDAIISRLAKTYAGSHTAGHRLLSLATDIARYWRTLRIDYKHKVDERKKPWAVRALKLRSARRLAYFSSALHMVAFGPRIDYAKTDGPFDLGMVEGFMKSMASNPVERLIAAVEKVEGDPETTRSLLASYEKTHLALGEPSVRDALDGLDETTRMASGTFKEIRSGCVAMHGTAADLIRKLPDEHQKQMIEMFLL